MVGDSGRLFPAATGRARATALDVTADQMDSRRADLTGASYTRLQQPGLTYKILLFTLLALNLSQRTTSVAKRLGNFSCVNVECGM